MASVFTSNKAQPSKDPLTVRSPEPIQPQLAVESKMEKQNPLTQWPKSNINFLPEKWITININLVQLLAGRKEDVEIRY